jgi:Tfp pilus tip-associated adhesin PilY1
MISRTPRSLRRAAPWALVVAACSMSGSLSGRLAADDRGLLRFDSAKPYLFLLLDTSGSMASAPGDVMAPANGDDPASKLFSARKVSYDVFSSVTDVQFGLATFNQDSLRVRGKHWLYTAAAGTSATVKASLPVSWPADGEQWVFGTFFPAGTQDVTGNLTVPAAGTLGSPAAGVSLTTYQSALDRFPKLQDNDDNGNRLVDQSDSSQSTVLYVVASGKTYQYTLSRVTGSNNLGDPTITVQVTVRLCSGGSCAGTASTANLTFNFVTAFLMLEGPTSPATASLDNQTGVWNYGDALQSWNGQSNKFFSGAGIEGNYDGTFTNPPVPSSGVQQRNIDVQANGYDPYATTGGCTWQSSGTDGALCQQNLKYPTTIAPPIPGVSRSTAALDVGDLLPLNWNDTNQLQLLTRFAPDQATGTPSFGQAKYFYDIPDPTTGLLALKDPGQIPMIAAGPTPLGNAIIDYRCWYLGDSAGGSKCNNTGNYTTSWSDLAKSEDTSWGCRQPYLIIISDGNDTTGGPDPTADVANLHSKAGVQTWVIAYGAPVDKNGNCNPGHPLDSIAKAGKGQLICPSNPQQLQDALLSILGIIREQTREFASAAVPSVQASVSDKIFLSDFTPAKTESVWEGHVNAFLKPLPIDPATGKPDTKKLCSSQPSGAVSGCFLWDAGAQLLNQVPAAAPYVGDTASLRRIYYSELAKVGSWQSSRQPLQHLASTDAQSIRYDLWRGFQIPFQPDNPIVNPPTGTDPVALAALNNVIDAGPCTVKNPGPPCGVETTRTHTFTDPVTGVTTTDTYNLGDIFHSNPLIVGTPTNVKFFALNLNANPNGTCSFDSSANTDTGYRCFETRHTNRRKLLLVGSNDGMVHAFDAGQAHATTKTPPPPLPQTPTTTVNFDDGSGREVWAYMPRAVMPTVKAIANGSLQHWTVDGPIQGADVFIDPAQSGTPDPTKREWRSVVVAGLREGPEAGTGGINGYYALDITQPDQLTVSSDGVYYPKAYGATPLPAAGTPVQFYLPDCDALGSPLDGKCGHVPYPSPLWEFYDQAHNADGSTALDANGNPVLIHEGATVGSASDLGHTWSTPTIGRIRIADSSGKTIDKYVAVFGGGLDPDNKTSDTPNAGNWLYMVDVETGKAIYKRQLQGCAASAAAAVDTDQVGLITRIYIGTTSGHMYRVDVGPNAAGHLPQLQNVNVLGTDGKQHVEQRITVDPDSGQTIWAPREIFNANYNGATLSTTPRSIYYRPSVIFVASLGLYGLAFGTGDREDLWSSDPQAQRYYLFVDDTDLLSPSALPRNESDFTAISVTNANTSTDILETSPVGQRGWFLILSVVTDSSSGTTQNFTERVITDSFALSGINTFSTFEPDICFNIDPVTLQCKSGSNGTCSKGGTGRIFVTFTINANTVLTDLSGNDVRYYNAPTFVTPPYTEQSQTKNPAPGTPPPQGTNADQLTPQLISVMNTLKKLFPRNCRFGNYRIDIKAISGDTGVIFIAPVPICIVEKNWKELP